MKGIAVRFVLTGVGALLPLVAAAQLYRPEALEDAPAEPALVLGLSPSGIDVLNRERAREARALDAFARGKVGADRLAQQGTEQPGPWVVYARVYVLNYQGSVSETRFALTDSHVGLGRTGPSIAGRIYIGIRKRF